MIFGIKNMSSSNHSVTAGYDFQDSNENHFNVLTLYNSTYENASFIPMPFALLRIPHSLNAVRIIFFADIKLKFSHICFPINPLKRLIFCCKILTFSNKDELMSMNSIYSFNIC
jgi:hypothetical protein